jgi:hypothetical protein
MTKPVQWTDEDRAEFAEQLTDAMVTQMTLEDMRQCVWDLIYDDLVHQKWPDLLMNAQVYAPELLEGG